jgi:hypothetical protein
VGVSVVPGAGGSIDRGRRPGRTHPTYDKSTKGELSYRPEAKVGRARSIYNINVAMTGSSHHHTRPKFPIRGVYNYGEVQTRRSLKKMVAYFREGDHMGLWLGTCAYMDLVGEKDQELNEKSVGGCCSHAIRRIKVRDALGGVGKQTYLWGKRRIRMNGLRIIISPSFLSDPS